MLNLSVFNCLITKFWEFFILHKTCYLKMGSLWLQIFLVCLLEQILLKTSYQFVVFWVMLAVAPVKGFCCRPSLPFSLLPFLHLGFPNAALSHCCAISLSSDEPALLGRFPNLTFPSSSFFSSLFLDRGVPKFVLSYTLYWWIYLKARNLLVTVMSCLCTFGPNFYNQTR